MTNTVTVIGTVFADCKGFAKNKYLPQGRNLGAIQFVHGGVGRNVAENLANLELNTAFVSTIDKSGLGLEIKQRLSDARVNTGFMKPANEGMGMWLAVMDENGDLAGSISQMPNLLEIEKILAEAGPKIAEASSHIVLELDLTEQISDQVLTLASRYNKPVFGIPGNLDVVLKNKSMLGRLECFICNEVEAERLFEKSFAGMSHKEILQELISYADAAGLRSMVVTLGAQGSLYYDTRTKENGYQPVFPIQLVDSSGAGDAFFSGTVTGLIRGLALRDAVVCGTKVAGWTIESPENNCRELKEKVKQDPFFQKMLVK